MASVVPQGAAVARAPDSRRRRHRAHVAFSQGCAYQVGASGFAASLLRAALGSIVPERVDAYPRCVQDKDL